jgi:predicted Zn-dependent protease
LLLARLAELEGRREEALGGYLRALELGAFAPGVVRRAASLLAAGGRVEAADRLTAIARARGTTGRDFLRTAAEIALRARNFEHAAELARLAVPADSGSASEQLWLGRVLAAGGRDTEAAAALRRAVRLAPDSPEAWLSLLAHLGRTGPAEQGDAALAEMKGKLPAGLRLLRP